MACSLCGQEGHNVRTCVDRPQLRERLALARERDFPKQPVPPPPAPARIGPPAPRRKHPVALLVAFVLVPTFALVGCFHCLFSSSTPPKPPTRIVPSPPTAGAGVGKSAR